MKSKLCRKCGEAIGFMPRPGFIPAGQPKYYTVNLDDHKPHYRRCQITLALREARKSGSRSAAKKQQGSRAKPETSTTEGVQLDAFETT